MCFDCTTLGDLSIEREVGNGSSRRSSTLYVLSNLYTSEHAHSRNSVYPLFPHYRDLLARLSQGVVVRV